METLPAESGSVETMDTFKVRVGVVVLDKENRILLARQNHRDFWVLPGGTLEKGESLGECAVREIKEESNLDIRLGPLLFVSDFFAPDGRQVIDVVFFGHYLGGSLERETTQNIDEIGFFTLDNAKGLDVKPESVFERILAQWQNESWECGDYIPPESNFR